MIGINTPDEVFVFDLRTGRLGRAATTGVSIMAAAAKPGTGEAWVAGLGTLLHYRFTRDADGRLAYKLKASHSTALGESLAVAWIPQRDRLAIRNEKGKVLLVNPAALESGPAVEGIGESRK